jgi:hypothetical protein
MTTTTSDETTVDAASCQRMREWVRESYRQPHVRCYEPQRILHVFMAWDSTPDEACHIAVVPLFTTQLAPLAPLLLSALNPNPPPRWRHTYRFIESIPCMIVAPAAARARKAASRLGVIASSGKSTPAGSWSPA